MAGHQPVPHHPAAGGEVEEPVARAHVAVQLVFLQVLQGTPPWQWTMHLGTPVVPLENMMKSGWSRRPGEFEGRRAGRPVLPPR